LNIPEYNLNILGTQLSIGDEYINKFKLKDNFLQIYENNVELRKNQIDKIHNG
jgi:hypothetical protein